MYKLLIVLSLFSKTVQSQEPKDWGAFMKVINAKTYAGKKFRVEAAVKVQLIDSSADAEVWVRVENNVTGCYSVGSFFLEINTPLLLTFPTPLNVSINC